MLKKIALSLLTLALTILLVALVVPFFIPASEYKQHILALIEDKTGHKVSVEGNISFTVLPSIALKVEDVTIANSQGFQTPYFAKIESLRLKLGLWPLLDRRVVVEELEVTNPIIYAEENAIGKRNWELGAAGVLRASTAESGSANPAVKSSRHSTVTPQRLSYDIGRIMIRGGAMTYQSPGHKIQATALNLAFTPEELVLDMAIIPSSVSVSTDPSAGSRYRLQVLADTPSLLWEGKPLPLQVELESPEFSFSGEGEVSGMDVVQKRFTPQYQGSMLLSAPSAVQLQKALIGKENWPDSPLRMESQQVTLDAARLLLATLQVELGSDLAASGQFELHFAKTPAKPFVKADLAIPALNLEQFAQQQGSATQKREGQSTSMAWARGWIADAGAADAAADAVWSKEPLDFSVLNQVNAQVNLRIEALQSGALVLEKMTLAGKLNQGVLKVQSNEFDVAGGSASLIAELNANDLMPSWRKEITLKAVQFEQIALYFTEASRLEGPMSGQMMFMGSGHSMDDWMQTLSGGGEVAIQRGVIRGYSLPKLFRNVKAAFMPEALRKVPSEGNEDEEKEKDTSFSRLTLHFTADKGIIRIKTGELQAPLLQTSATGTVSLREKTVDLYLKPVIVPSLSSESGPNAGLMVPLRLRGPFSQISFTPDLTAAVKEAVENPERLKDAASVLHEEGRNLRAGIKAILSPKASDE